MQVIRERGRVGWRAVLVVLLLAFGAPAAAQDEASGIGEILSAGAPPVTDIDAALGAEALADLKQVYAARNDRPLWLGSDAGRDLLVRLSQPDMIIGPKLQPLLDDARNRFAASDSSSRAGADLLLTALYGATALALRPGGPKGFAAAMTALSTTADLASLLREPQPPQPQQPAVETPKVETPKVETPKVETPVAAAPKVEAPATPAAPPEPPAVARLRAAIAALQPMAEQGWPLVPEGPKLQLGDSDPRVEALRRRLIGSGDFQAATTGSTFDPALQTALKRFQARHGLPNDGVAGAATIAALNVPAKDRLAGLTASLQRLERAGRDWGNRYLLVNIPAATYRLVQSGAAVAEGPVILGAASTPTPAIDGMIDRIELRPSYRIPQSLADRTLWPRQEEDALYFMNNGIRVTDDGLRQVPGAGNPLGIAKLRIAGHDRIALHGTPNGSYSKTQFDSPDRHTSLGCVALPNVAEVARRLLAADPGWTDGRIAGALAVGGTQTVTLAQPLPVHFVYETAWVDEDGTAQFRDDVYGWDRQPPAAEPNTVAEPCGS